MANNSTPQEQDQARKLGNASLAVSVAGIIVTVVIIIIIIAVCATTSACKSSTQPPPE